jgi:hypothetical protein
MSPEQRKAILNKVETARAFIQPGIVQAPGLVMRSSIDIALENLADAIDLLLDTDEAATK